MKNYGINRVTSGRQLRWKNPQTNSNLEPFQLNYWDKATPIEDTMRTLNDLVRQGKLKNVTLADLEKWQIEKTKDTGEYMGLEKVVYQDVSHRSVSQSNSVNAKIGHMELLWLH